MKKILALLLALMMALSCVGAVAEETQSNEPAFALPSFTLTWEEALDVDAILSLLSDFGLDETLVAQAQAILPLLANTNGQIVFADNGVEFDLGLKGQNVLSVGAELTEEGITLASDILPSYVLTLSTETIQAVVEQVITQFTSQSEALSGVDMNALAESLMTYAMQYSAALSGAVTMGEPEFGEYVFEDKNLEFNCKMPIIVDMEAIKDAVLTLMDQIKNDEAFGSLFSALGSMGMNVDLSSSEDVNVIMPNVEVNAYTIVDEEGKQADDMTFVTVDVSAAEEELTMAVNVCVLVDEGTVAVEVKVPEQNIAFTFYAEPTETGVVLSCIFEGMGIEAMELMNINTAEGLNLYSEFYLMDLENPISVDQLTFGMGGERTFAVQDENKTVFPVEQLMADTEGEAMGALLGDVMSNGLGNLIAKVSEILPDEVAALMSMMAPAE